MRVQHVAQAAKSWPDATENDCRAGTGLAETIERIRWRLWHGQVRRALNLIAETVVTMDAAADDKSPIAAAARKVARLLGELETYVVGQSDQASTGSFIRARGRSSETLVIENSQLPLRPPNAVGRDCKHDRPLASTTR
jgi:hypothetical protein